MTRILLTTWLLFSILPIAQSKIPQYSADESGVHIQGVDPSNPIIYDNDWWTDIFDAYYLWAQADLGNAILKGNIVTRDMWDHPDYQYDMAQCMNDAEKAVALAWKSGIENIPQPIAGADQALSRPESGKIEDTAYQSTPGSRLIIQEAKNASPEKPLLIMAGGPLTTVANALLEAPEITDNIIVFALSVSFYRYNGKDGWSVYVVAKKTRLVEWATGDFWDKNSVFQPGDFEVLPDTPLKDELQRFIRTGLGQANQLGDGAVLVWLFNNRCWRGVKERATEFNGRAAEFPLAPPRDVLDIPKNQSDLDLMKNTYFETMANEEVYK